MRITIEIGEEGAQLAELLNQTPFSRHAIARAALRAGLNLLLQEPSLVARLLGGSRVQVPALASIPTVAVTIR